jgi:hypothetical protein
MLMVVAVTIGSYMWSEQPEMCDGSPIANDSMRGRNEDGSRIWTGVLICVDNRIWPAGCIQWRMIYV